MRPPEIKKGHNYGTRSMPGSAIVALLRPIRFLPAHSRIERELHHLLRVTAAIKRLGLVARVSVIQLQNFNNTFSKRLMAVFTPHFAADPATID